MGTWFTVLGECGVWGTAYVMGNSEGFMGMWCLLGVKVFGDDVWGFGYVGWIWDDGWRCGLVVSFGLFWCFESFVVLRTRCFICGGCPVWCVGTSFIRRVRVMNSGVIRVPVWFFGVYVLFFSSVFGVSL